MTYAEVLNLIRGKRGATRRKVDNNTYAEILSDDSIGIKLHNTYVVKIQPDNIYSLHTGGWYTPTTKDRINQYFPGNVYQKNGDWFVERNGKTFPFVDGMTIE